MPIPSPKSGESEDDFISRCIGNKTMKDDFPDRDQRLAVCFDSFRDNTKHGEDEEKKKVKSNMIVLQATAGKARRETFNGVEHIIIPVIALVEGVLQSGNANQPELALASEFGKAPAGWNGRPVTVNHPEIRGHKVSANSPEVLETEQIGQLFNTILVDKKLRTEAWISVDRVNKLNGDISETVERLLNGDIVEVSTGLFSDIEAEHGTHKGEEFFGVWRNVVPDHLAILTKGNIGSCSVADGCGANRVNKGNPTMESPNGKPDNGVASNSQKGNDARNEQLSLFEKIKSFVGIRDNTKHSHNTTLRAIEAALDQEEAFQFVVDVFDDHFILQKEGGLFRRDFKITQSGKVKLSIEMTTVRPEINFVELKVNEEESDMSKDALIAGLIANEAVQFDDSDKEWLSGLDEDQLKKLTPATAKVEGIAAVITPEMNTLMANVKAEDLHKTVEAALRTHMKATKAAEDETALKAQEEKNAKTKGETKPQTVEQYIAAAPPELQEVLTSGIRAHDSRRSDLTEVIKANSRNKFSDEDLAKMGLATLESVATLAITDDFSGRGGPRMNQEDPNAVPAAPEVYDLSAKRKAS